MKKLCFSLLLIILSIMVVPLQADVIFPARLEVKEINSGEFSVVFTLPIINNKKLKAKPLLPPVFEDISDHSIEGDYASYKESWMVSADPEALYGQEIGIEGLIGTQIDILLSIETLSGRKYSTTLKPSRAIFIIPEPPSFFTLFFASAFYGMHRLLIRIDLLLLLFLMAHRLNEKRGLFYGLIGYISAHYLGQYLAQQKWLLVSPSLPAILILFIVFFSALDLAQGRSGLRKWFKPVWVLPILLGLLNGGASSQPMIFQGFSITEQHIVTLSFNIGIGLGLLVGFFLMRELIILISQIIWPDHKQQILKLNGYIIGILSAGLIFYKGSFLLLTPFVLPDVPSVILLIPIVFGVWLWSIDIGNNEKILLILLLLFGLGLTLGLFEVPFLFGTLALLGSLLLFAVLLVFRWGLPKKVIYPVVLLSVIFYSWTTGYFIIENLTLPIANAIGLALLALFIFFISLNFSIQPVSERYPNGVRYLGLTLIILAIFWRVSEYYQWYDSKVATEMALGLIRLPVLSLLLLMIVIVIWPRRRKIHQHLEIKVRRPIMHWIALMLAFLLIPHGDLKIKNPFYTARAPQAEQAKRVLQQVLANTYQAFNIDEEDNLYERLALSVSDDLIGDIYLDSRRRLRAGVRQGAEVTVRDVSVISVSDLIDGSNPSEGFSYESKWSVTARVKHLQHVHHRRNIYSGVLKIKADSERWKIAAIELKSEDRVIIPGSTG